MCWLEAVAPPGFLSYAPAVPPAFPARFPKARFPKATFTKAKITSANFAQAKLSKKTILVALTPQMRLWT